MPGGQRSDPREDAEWTKIWVLMNMPVGQRSLFWWRYRVDKYLGPDEDAGWTNISVLMKMPGGQRCRSWWRCRVDKVLRPGEDAGWTKLLALVKMPGGQISRSWWRCRVDKALSSGEDAVWTKNSVLVKMPGGQRSGSWWRCRVDKISVGKHMNANWVRYYVLYPPFAHGTTWIPPVTGPVSIFKQNSPFNPWALGSELLWKLLRFYQRVRNA
jgi:hypothetical protein